MAEGKGRATVTVTVIDENSFDVARGADGEILGTVRKRPEGYWEARQGGTPGTGELLHAGKSRGGCIFTIIRRHAGF